MFVELMRTKRGDEFESIFLFSAEARLVGGDIWLKGVLDGVVRKDSRI